MIKNTHKMGINPTKYYITKRRKDFKKCSIRLDREVGNEMFIGFIAGQSLVICWKWFQGSNGCRTDFSQI